MPREAGDGVLLTESKERGAVERAVKANSKRG